MKREKGSVVRIGALVNLGSVEEVGFLVEGWRDGGGDCQVAGRALWCRIGGLR